MIDFAVNTCGYDVDEFFDMFLASNVCKQFENGNPAYIAGKTCREVAERSGVNIRTKHIKNINGKA